MCQVNNRLKNTGEKGLECYKVFKVYYNPSTKYLAYLSPVYNTRWIKGRRHVAPWPVSLNDHTHKGQNPSPYFINGGYYHMFMHRKDAEEYKEMLSGSMRSALSVQKVIVPPYTDYYEGVVQLGDEGEYKSIASNVVIF